jgi:2-oxoglutarate dehydrogenase E1 component
MSDPLLGGNISSLAFVEALYASYLNDAQSVTEDWQAYFDAFEKGMASALPFRSGPSFRPKSLFTPVHSQNGDVAAPTPSKEAASLQHRVEMLVRNYRVRAHRRAMLNPLATICTVIPEINPKTYGLGESHMDMRFSTDFLAGGGTPTLREILQSAENTYCRSIGAQYMHIDDLQVREWLQQRMESTENHIHLSREEQTRTLYRLTRATLFEEFLQKKFIGAKSFSLEGAETLIPLLDYAIESAGAHGIDEILIGMPHRGRLNVLANIMGKPLRQIFREFEERDPAETFGRGDVKYHQGHHTEWTTAAGKAIELSLAFNPSHLEFVNPVVLGRLRARNDRFVDTRGERSVAFLIHGDAAFAGEGIVQETLNLSQLPAYQVGGAIHIIVNNNIGFTTLPEQSRSTYYASDVAKMLQIPILHVNGEDPEAVAQTVQLSMDFRKQFRRDVVIDMHCYRRRGHNEGDEPAFTQPMLYRAIRERKSVRQGYLDHLLLLGGISREEADALAKQTRAFLEQALAAARKPGSMKKPTQPDYGPGTIRSGPGNFLKDIWRRYPGGPEKNVPAVDTSVERTRLADLLVKLATLPKDFHPHPKIKRLLKTRNAMATGDAPLDWAAGEALAFASLAEEGIRIRLTGQDAERGTFSHRHAVLHDHETGRQYSPFQDLSNTQGAVDIINSALSETGVLGFEYGYSGGRPDGLVLWEAQFGDFTNVAQVIIDQFLTTAEDKWERLSGLVLLLPHGLEGTGPEHASARLERFLQLAAEDNIQVVNCTTPAQFFHCLRRQVHRLWRKPLIVMAPKSMLRHPRAVSSLEELAEGAFQPLIPDAEINPKGVNRVLLCSGKIYYDLLQQRENLRIDDVAILRVEQLYPLETAALDAALAPYADGIPVVWTQEEPENMGAWHYMSTRFRTCIERRFRFQGVYRDASATPATGSALSHKYEQGEIVALALGVAVRLKNKALSCPREGEN